ncbi:hypothetical protein ACIPWY_20400 [Streptomyces sp. NPDC090032]|uniref:hypothetical protein n=1 Tax=unclassified Streptomyces TaxID=2593676 RepID=UPI0037169927
MSKGGASISDEEWERFQKEAEAGTRGAPEEPSARARMVTRRLREETARPAGWRTHEPARQRRGRGWYVVGLLVAAVMLFVALDPGRVTDWFGGGDRAETPLAEESERPGRPPVTESAAQRPTLQEPFKGSPAARWGDGTAGITVPEARATGWMSKAQVSQAIDRSRDFLAASNLDSDVLLGRPPAKAIALINPEQKDVQDYLATAFRTPSQDDDPLLLFSRFATDKVRLVGDVVKTRGRITYGEGKRGAVEVTTDVTYVYPVAHAAEGRDEVARTIVRREVVMSWDDPAKVITEPGTFSLVSYKSDTANGGCDNDTGFYVPEFPSARADTGPGAGPDVDPYDRSTTMDARVQGADDAECGTATRT